MAKILGLDLGDQWVGVAITDPSQTFVRPFTTIPAHTLDEFIAKTSAAENIESIVIGYPKTMRGGESAQTLKIVARAKELEEKFKNLQFVLWDERLTSKMAATLSAGKTKEEKLKSHALAASFILDSYVTYLHQKRNHD